MIVHVHVLYFVEDAVILELPVLIRRGIKPMFELVFYCYDSVVQLYPAELDPLPVIKTSPTTSLQNARRSGLSSSWHLLSRRLLVAHQ